MRKLILVFIALLLIVGTGFAAEKAMKTKAGQYDVELMFSAKPVVGEVPLTVVVKEAGKAVTDAKVTVEYYMTEKIGPTKKYIEMPYHRSEVETKVEPSGYAGKADFSMAGRWNVNIKIEKDGKISTAKFYVRVKSR